jgi:CheY-like chemotaxis protein
MTHNIKALVVMAQERRLPLLDALESCGIEVLPVCDCNEARRMLEAQPAVQVVVTDTTLPDGDWRRVLEIVEQGRRKIEIVVCSCLGDPKLLESYFLKQGERAARGVRQFRISFL